MKYQLVGVEGQVVTYLTRCTQSQQMRFTIKYLDGEGLLSAEKVVRKLAKGCGMRGWCCVWYLKGVDKKTSHLIFCFAHISASKHRIFHSDQLMLEACAELGNKKQEQVALLEQKKAILLQLIANFR